MGRIEDEDSSPEGQGMPSADPVDLYVPGTRAWVPDPVKGFAGAVIVSKSADGKIVLKREDKDETLTVVPDADKKNLPPLQNPAILDGVDDLTTLSHLHEPAVLHNVLVRYAKHTIYTYSGIVLVAFNPYQKLNLYGNDIVRTYANTETGLLEPHLFAVAENAYRALARDNRNQSIIVTGESGAGKTVSTKYVMRYFASVDNMGTEMSEVEERVMATNPIMESFGNAKTIRNNNSSRFGKYIQILFNDRNRISSAQIRTYLLERSRVVYQAEDERNYHVFYQLIKGAPQAEREELFLSHDIDDYFYINQGGCETVDDVNDVTEFAETQSALSKVGISVSEQWKIFRLLAAILHLGNTKITSNARDESSDIDTLDDTPFAYAAELLQVDRHQFAKWITKRNIVSRTETIVKPRNGNDALAARDSVCKFLYARLFDWLVAKVNVSLQNSTGQERFIGLLDIYGFEIFKQNSFEQFCINFANEKLQQEFVQHVFKLEQELYAREEIKWSYIDYADNQPCIDLIEGRMGIYSLLDEECRVPKGTDASFVQKLFDQLSVHGHLVKARMDKTAFIVKHYAQDVTYKGDGFLDKNRDSITDEQLELLQSSEDAFIGAIFGKKSEKTPSKSKKEVAVVAAASASKVTLGAQFKNSLVQLMEIIRSTSPHYIRCIKPNEQKAAFKFDPVQVLAQLRACGVLETIRISAAGYPSRHEFDDFAERYKMLQLSSKWSLASRELSQVILAAALQDEDKFQVGKTKIFLRAGQLAFLEKLRQDRLKALAILIQKNLRRNVQRRKYLALLKGVRFAQKLHRGRLARKLYRNKRRDRAIGIIRRYATRNLLAKRFKVARAAIVTLQTAMRAKTARRLCLMMKQRTSAVVIQSWWRAKLAVKKYKRLVYLMVKIQCCIRRRLAKLELRRLRMEARDLSRYKEVSYKLENKVIELTQLLAAERSKADSAEKERTAAAEKSNSFKDKIKAEQEAKEREHQQKQAALEQVSALQGQVDSLKGEVQALTSDKLAQDKKSLTLTQDLARSRAELTDANHRASSAQREIDTLKEQLARALAAAEQSNAVAAKAKEEVELLRLENASVKQELNAAVQAITHKPTNPIVKKLMVDRQIDDNQLQSPVPKPTPDELEAREWIFVNETNSTVFSFEGDYEKELTQKLIIRLKPVLIDPEVSISDYEVLFPAHVIATVVIHMMSHNMVEKIQSLMINTYKNIHQVVSKAEENNTLAFWLANSAELRSLLSSIETLINNTHNRVLENSRKDIKIHPLPPKVFSKLLNDSGYIVTEIYHCVMKKLREGLDKVVVPALLDFESQPSNRKLKGTFSLFASAVPIQSSITPAHLIAYLKETSKLLADYFVDDDIRRQIFTALMYQVAARAFNSLLLRKELCNPRRGVQIGLNVSAIDQWCKEHGFSEASIHLQTITQAAKLLQMPNGTIEHAEAAMDTCYLLNVSQVHKLLSNYRADNPDDDKGVPQVVLDFVHNVSVDADDELMMDMNASHTQFILPPARGRHKIHRYIPADVKLEFLSYMQQ